MWVKHVQSGVSLSRGFASYSTHGRVRFVIGIPLELSTFTSKCSRKFVCEFKYIFSKYKMF